MYSFRDALYTSVIDMDSLAAVSESEDILDLLSAKVLSEDHITTHTSPTTCDSPCYSPLEELT